MSVPHCVWMSMALGLSLIAPAVPAPIAPEGTAARLRGLIQSAHHPDLRWPDFPEFRSELERLYERADWQPLWLVRARPTEAARQLIARLAASDSLGLEPADYDPAWLGQKARELGTQSGSPPPPDELARFDLAISLAAVRFVSAIHRGRVSPRAMRAELFLPYPSLAVEMAVDSLRDAEQQGPILERLQPHFHHYHLLKNGLARYRALARDPGLVPLRGLPRTLSPGTALAAAAQLRRLLVATGDLGRTAPHRASADGIYSADLVAGVTRFQRRQGLEPDGVIGPQTAAQLNRPFEQRVRQIELTLERWRWLPPSFTAPPIIVNIPAFQLNAFRGYLDREDEMLAMDVVVGASFDTQTPVFAAEMRYLIFRPYWEVPDRITRDELQPRARVDPGFLRRQGMVLVSSGSDRRREFSPTHSNVERLGKDLRVRQRPGPQNALGAVKFALPNAHDVYLHDTAAKGLFARVRRDLSHGCIRVSDPTGLAAHVLRDQPEWTVERIRAAMKGADDMRVNLARPVPVYIVYQTAITHENGDVYFYSDIYGLDEKLDALLRQGYPYPK